MAPVKFVDRIRPDKGCRVRQLCVLRLRRLKPVTPSTFAVQQKKIGCRYEINDAPSVIVLGYRDRHSGRRAEFPCDGAKRTPDARIWTHVH